MRKKWMSGVMFVVLSVFSVIAQPPAPELSGDIVAGGLNGPQGLFVDSSGVLWIIDSGYGGDETIDFFNPTTLQSSPATLGNTARIIRLLDSGEQEVVASLPSIAVGEDFLGGARLVELDGSIYATVGAWQISAGEEVNFPFQAQVVRIDENGEAATVADLWAHELANNPDATDNIESHPYGIAAGADGLLYVTDAAANVLLSVDTATGETVTIAAFDGLPGVFPSAWRGGELLTDPVPTAVTFDSEGNLYVSLLSGAPFIPGSAKVLRVTPEGEVSDFATGFTMLTDLEMGPDGNFYAVQFGLFTQEGPVFNSGSVVRISPEGVGEVIIEGLPFATALAIDADGNGYVAINGIAIPDAGAVVYYEGLTSLGALSN